MIWRWHIHKVVLRLPDSWSNWTLEMLVFEERGKPEYPEKNLWELRREPTTNATHIWRWSRDLKPGHFGGRRALSPLRNPCSPWSSLANAVVRLLLIFRMGSSELNDKITKNKWINNKKLSKGKELDSLRFECYHFKSLFFFFSLFPCCFPMVNELKNEERKFRAERGRTSSMGTLLLFVCFFADAF